MKSGDDPRRLAPIWGAAFEYLKKHANRTVPVSELFELWRKPPFGVKDGLMPILAVAFVLSQRDKLAVYRDGIFRAKFDDVDVDYLAKDAVFIQLRWMDLTRSCAPPVVRHGASLFAISTRRTSLRT